MNEMSTLLTPLDQQCHSVQSDRLNEYNIMEYIVHVYQYIK